MSQRNAVFNVRLRLVCFLYVQALLFMCSGCATSAVWSNRHAWKYEPIAVANGKELSGESPALLKSRSMPEIRLLYCGVKRISDSAQEPPQPTGCIVLKNTDDSLRLLGGLESFLRSQSGKNIASIKAVICHNHPLHERGSSKYSFRLGLAFSDATFQRSTLQKIDSIWAPLLGGGPAQGQIKNYSSQNVNSVILTPLDSFIIDDKENTMSYFLVGGPSGGGPSGNTALMFVDECAKTNFVTLLNNDNSPFTILFVDAREIKQYKNSLPARILLTAFSVPLDVVTFPVQLILMATSEYWFPR